MITPYLWSWKVGVGYACRDLLGGPCLGGAVPMPNQTLDSSTGIFTKNIGPTSNKLQQKLFQVFPIQKNVLYNILKVLRNPLGGKHRKRVICPKITIVNIINILVLRGVVS